MGVISKTILLSLVATTAATSLLGIRSIYDETVMKQGIASAKKEAKDLYDRGQTQLDLGQPKLAVASFCKASAYDSKYAPYCYVTVSSRTSASVEFPDRSEDWKRKEAEKFAAQALTYAKALMVKDAKKAYCMAAGLDTTKDNLNECIKWTGIEKNVNEALNQQSVY